MKPVLLIVVLLGFSVQAEAVTLAPAPTGAQTVRYAEGAPSIISERKSITCVTVLPEANGHVVLLVAGRNRSTQNINFGAENVSANANGRALRVFTYEELAKRIKSSAFWKGMAGAAGAGFQAGGASQPARTAYSGQYYGSNNYGQYQGNYFGQATTTDPAAQAMAQSAIMNDARAQGAAINAERDQRLATLRHVLRTTTLQPGQWYGGIIEVARPPAPSIMNVRVGFAGEAHTFSFRVAR